MDKKETTEKKEDKQEITIEDLPGVGAATAEKLMEAGYDSLMAIAVASPSEIAPPSMVNKTSCQLDKPGFSSEID